MSLSALQYAWDEPVDNAADKAVFVALAWHANAQGEGIRPGLARLERMTSLAAGTISKARKRLIDAGLLEQTQRTSSFVEYRLPGMGDLTERQSRVDAASNKRSEKGKKEEDLPPTPTAQVWASYVEAMEPRRRELDPESARIIQDALKVASVMECIVAIRGCRSSAFHMGSNEKGRPYNQLSQILKGKRGRQTTRERIDFFIDLAAKAGVESGATSAPPAIVSQRKRDVLDAAEFPGDEQVVSRGEESARWLREHGWLVERGDDGFPTFRRAEKA